MHALIEAGSGPEFDAIRPKQLIDMAADNAGLHPDLLATILHHNAPVARHFDQNAVGNGLPAEARARGAKRQRNVRLVAEAEQRLDLFRPIRQHDRFRDQTVEAGVGSEGHQLNGTG